MNEGMPAVRPGSESPEHPHGVAQSWNPEKAARLQEFLDRPDRYRIPEEAVSPSGVVIVVIAVAFTAAAVGAALVVAAKLALG